MRRRYPQVSWELILSGRGFRTLHEFTLTESYSRYVEDPDADPCAGNYPRGWTILARLFRRFGSVDRLYGAEAGNLALKVLGSAVVYVAGGIAVKTSRK